MGTEEGVKDEGLRSNLLLKRAGVVDGLEMDSGGAGNLVCRSISSVEGSHVGVGSSHAVPDV